MTEKERRYPVKYHRDCGERRTLGDCVEELADIIDREGTTDEFSEYLDREFLYGCWGHLLGRVEELNRDCLRDLRGIIYAMYRAGYGRGVKQDTKT